MKLRGALFALLFLMATQGRATELTDDSVQDFARKWFSLDLQKQSFGARQQTFQGLKSDWAENEIHWYSATNFPPEQKMHLLYGFQKDILVAVQVFAVGKERADKILADFVAIQGMKQSQFQVNSKSYQVCYEGVCSPAPEENRASRITFKILAKEKIKL